MLDASGLFGFFGVVPAIQRAYEVASDAAEAFELAFVKIFGMSIEVFFGGFFVAFGTDELDACFYEAGNMESFVLIELGKRFGNVFFGNFGVFA